MNKNPILCKEFLRIIYNTLTKQHKNPPMLQKHYNNKRDTIRLY